MRWISAFLDLPADRHAAGTAYWSAVTGFAVSSPRGEMAEFTTLEPSKGDAYVRVQRVGDGPARVHLDLHVVDPRWAADRAIELGAREVADLGYVSLVSPGGLAFCFVANQGSVRPAAAEWVPGEASRVYQVSIDAPRAAYEVESTFWSSIVGAPATVMARRPEYAFLPPVRGAAMTLLLQRLEEPDGPVRAHLDVGATNRPAEVARHVGLGGQVVADEEFWTVLRDPAGTTYCITDRDPYTGDLP